jgi:hypothetical protein
MTINSPPSRETTHLIRTDCWSNEIVKYNDNKLPPSKQRVVSLEGGSLLSLYFTISLHQKSVLIRGAACLEGGGLLSLYFTISLHQKSVLIRWVVSLEGGEFIVIVFYYFIASEICPDKRGGLPWGGRVYCHCILPFHCIRNLSW